jgi:translocation and assembly module TamA
MTPCSRSRDFPPVPLPFPRLLRLLAAAALLLLHGEVHAQEVRVWVELSDIDKELKTNVEALTAIVAASKSGGRTEGHVESMHERAPEQIAQALEPFGYYRVRVEGELDTSGSTWVARYSIDPGPPMQIGNVDLRIRGEGEQDSAFQALVRDFPLAAGDTLRHQAYEAAKSSIARLGAERGYLDATFDSTAVLVDLEEYTSQVVLHFTTGPRFRLGEVTFVQDVVDDYILWPFVQFEPGDPFELEKLTSLQSAMSGTTYFSSVEVRPRRDLAGEDRIVPIEIEAAPRKTQRYEIGVGYSTDTGARIRLTAEFRRLNRPGHYADTDLRISQRDRSIGARYNIPVGLPEPSLWTIGGRYGRTTWTTSETWQGLVGLSYSHLRGPLHEVISLHFQRDDFVVGPDTAISNLTMAGSAWTYTVADNRIVATRGFGATLDVRGSVQGAGSSVSLLRGLLGVKWIRSLTDKLRYALRADVGALATSDFRGLPPNARFFAGGDQSIRGYAYRSLGATDEQGNVIGGNTLLVGSAELEYRFLNKWGGAVFVDGGNALQDFKGELALGAGFGVRWISPVGLIRIDWAWGFQRNAGRVHLIIGPDF